MAFPLTGFLDEQACNDKLVALPYPDGLACPRRSARARLKVHRRHREPVLDYRCRRCGRAFNAWTGTIPQGTQRRPFHVLLTLRGIAQGTSTARLARELGCDRMKLPALLRRRLRGDAGLSQRGRAGADSFSGGHRARRGAASPKSRRFCCRLTRRHRPTNCPRHPLAPDPAVRKSRAT